MIFFFNPLSGNDPYTVTSTVLLLHTVKINICYFADGCMNIFKSLFLFPGYMQQLAEFVLGSCA